MHFLDQVLHDLHITVQQIHNISAAFRQEMIAGLAQQPSSLKMLPSYLDKPRGDEQGTFIVLDFGGTNVRVNVVELLGQGCFQLRDHISSPLIAPDKSYNYTSYSTTAKQLFDFLAEQIAMVLQDYKVNGLGHTFSFPCRQLSINHAVLIRWTKEFATQGVEGQDVTVLLKKALSRKGIGHLQPLAIINDTVGTLLTAAYCDPVADIGSICGTGHNTCYAQPLSSGGSMIINLESGNFNKLPITEYDQQLDKQSEEPLQQCLEKMTSGKYLGELFRLILMDMVKKGILDDNLLADYQIPYSLPTEQMVSMAQAGKTTSRVCMQTIQCLAYSLIRRSARLVAATYLGILQHIDDKRERKHTIAIDGSFYEKTPGYKEALKEVLAAEYQEEKVKVILSKDGSGLGAAIAAAQAHSKNMRKVLNYNDDNIIRIGNVPH